MASTRRKWRSLSYIGTSYKSRCLYSAIEYCFEIVESTWKSMGNKQTRRKKKKEQQNAP